MLSGDTPTPSRATSRARFAVLALCIVPVLLQLYAILTLVPFAPYADDWRIVHFMFKAQTGTAGLADFFETSGMHQLLVIKFVYYLIAVSVGWNPLAQSLFGFACTILSLLVLLKFQRQSGASPVGEACLALITTVFVFSLADHCTFLWGFMLVWPLINLLSLGAILILQRAPVDQGKLVLRVVLAALLCALATWTHGQGIVAWPPAAFMILSLPDVSLRRRIALLVPFTVFGTIMVGLWLYSMSGGTEIDKQADSVAAVLSQILLTLGGIVQATGWMGVGAGVVLVIAFVLLSVYGLLNPELRTRARPWIAIGIFVIVFAVATGRTRSGHGVGFTYRWYSLTVLIFISLMNLLVMAGLPSRRAVVRGAVPAALALLFLFAAAKSWKGYRNARTDYLPEKIAAGTVLRLADKVVDPTSHEPLRKAEIWPPFAVSFDQSVRELASLTSNKVPPDVKSPAVIRNIKPQPLFVFSGPWTAATREAASKTNVIFVSTNSPGSLYASFLVTSDQLKAENWTAAVHDLALAGELERKQKSFFVYDPARGSFVPMEYLQMHPAP